MCETVGASPGLVRRQGACDGDGVAVLTCPSSLERKRGVRQERGLVIASRQKVSEPSSPPARRIVPQGHAAWCSVFIDHSERLWFHHAYARLSSKASSDAGLLSMARPDLRVCVLLVYTLIFPGLEKVLCLHNGLARRPPMVRFCLLVILHPH